MTNSIINAQDVDGMTPLHCAVEANTAANLQLLLLAGANPEIKDKKGRTPFLFACSTPHSEIIPHFFENQTNIHAVDDDENTALHIACMNNRDQVVRYLIQTNQFDKETVNKSGKKPIDLTTSETIKEMLK